MKKIAAVIAILLISTTVFADIIIQQDYEGVGITTEIIGDNIISALENREGSVFTPSYGLSSSFLIEFNARRNSPVRYNIGLTAGADGPGFTTLVTGGLSLEIVRIGRRATDIRADIRIGPCFSFENMVIPILQTDLMLDFLNANRKGFYSSIGITDHIQNVAFPEMNLADAHIINYFGLIFAAGWRF